MDEVFSANFQHSTVTLPSDRRRKKHWKKFRSVLIITITSMVLVSTYFLYSLHFHPHSATETLLKSKTHAKQISAEVNEKGSNVNKLPHLFNPPHDKHTTESPLNPHSGFKLFSKETIAKPPKRKGKGTDKGKEVQKPSDEQESPAPPSANSIDSQKGPTSVQTKDSQDTSKEWQKRFQQQNMILQQQAKLLQRLQNQIQSKQNPFRRLPDKQLTKQQKYKTTQQPGTAAPRVSGESDGKVSAHTLMTKTVQLQALRQSKQSYKPRKAGKARVASQGSVLDGVESFDGEIKGMFKGIVFKKNEPLHLAVNGIQPRRHYMLDSTDTVQHAAASAEKKLALNARRQENSQRPNKLTETKPSPKHNINSKHGSDKHTNGKYTNDKHDSGSKHTNDKNTIGKYTKGPFGVRLENKIEKVVEDRKDKLLEEKFQELMKSFIKAKPGFKPKVQLENDNLITTSTPVTHKPEESHRKDDTHEHSHQSHSKPASNVKLSVFDLSKPAQAGHYACHMLKLQVFSRVICTDSGTTNNLVSRHSPQERELIEFHQALGMRKDMGALDLGAGLGIFTVAAATLPRPVIAVEPDKNTVRLFHKTMELNNLAHSVTLLTDAVGQRSGVGWLHRVKGPPGDTAVKAEVEYASSFKEAMAKHPNDVVNIVNLDSLVPVVTFRHVVLRLNVPGSDNKILKGGRRFFANVDVQFVVMQWLPSQYRLQCIEAASMLRQFGLEPARSVQGKVLTQIDLQKDQDFVVWRKK